MDDKNASYYIGDIARELDLSQRTIRYYEELGFIKPLRTEGGFRTYSAHDMDILRLIVRFKDLGLTLEDIRSLIPSGGKELTSEFVRHMRETLLGRRKEFESMEKKYADGVEQIDHVLNILENCTTCGSSNTENNCDQCIKQHGGEVPSLIDPLLKKGLN